MADLTPVVSLVKPLSLDSRTSMVTAGEVVTEGDILHFDTATEKWKVSACTDPVTADAGGLCLTSGILDDPIVIMLPGSEFSLGATTAAAQVYVLSEAGLICPVEDLLAADYLTIIGWGTGTDSIFFSPTVTGQLKA